MSKKFPFIVNPFEDSTLPNFDSIVGMNDLKNQLRISLIEPLKNPLLYDELGLSAGDKYLLFGPPGCGKSFIARAIAGEAKSAYFELTPGSTVAKCNPVETVQNSFQEARFKAPSVVVIDEVESLTENREAYSESAHMRVFLNEMLIQMDDTIHKNDKVLVIGSTNAPWYVDGAFLRSGRFGHVVFVPPPDQQSRLELIRKLTIGDHLSTETLEEASVLSNGFSFADIVGSLKKARQSALKEMLMKNQTVHSAKDVALTSKNVIDSFKIQYSSVNEWFKKFESRSPTLHKNLVEPIREYLRQNRKS